MQRRGLRLALAVLVALALSAAGCEVRVFRVQVPGFDTMGVRGMWVWRQAPGSGEYERYVQLEFADRVVYEGTELLSYSLQTIQGPMDMQTTVERAPGSPDSVTLHLAFVQVPGSFKLSSYNESGESPLSAGTLVY